MCALGLTLVPPLTAQKLLHLHVGGTSQLNMGEEIRAAGDVDGDGLGDYVLGLPKRDANGQGSGEIRIYSGATGLLIRSHAGLNAGDQLGFSVVGVGDLNGDGHGEVLTGNPGVGNGGGATVFSGIDGSVLYTLTAASPNDQFGTDVASVEDVNFDNVPDFAVGAPRDGQGTNGESGSVTVYSGATGMALFTKYGDDHTDEFGARLRGAGDVNQDGRGDLIVGSVRDDNGGTNAGSAHLISGDQGATLWRADGEAKGDEFGNSLGASGDDMNGDGTPDVVVGTDQRDYVHVLSGVDGSVIRRVSAGDTGSSGTTFGHGVTALGDIDGDGLGEYAVGDFTAYVLGQVRVFSGATGDEIYVLTWVDQNDRYGSTVENVGDLNGDGLDEFAIGAFGFDPAPFGNAGRAAIHSPQAPIGTRYCNPAVVGSSGRPATISAYGSTVIADECFSLTANALPIGTFGYFFAGTAQNMVMPGGTIGVVCVGGANVARFNSMDMVIRGPGGSIEVDLLRIPGNPPRPVTPGESWHFQCWFRDSDSAGSATSNFTDAVRVTFQ